MEKFVLKKAAGPSAARPRAARTGVLALWAPLFAAALLALTGCPGELIPDPAFVPVKRISGVPASGTAGIPVDLSGARVVPENATYRDITWSVANPGDTGVLTADIVGGKFTPAHAGTMSLRATVANGTAEGTDYAHIFSISIAAGVSWTFSVDGANNTASSTAIRFVFNEAVSGLTADDISLAPGTGAAAKGALTGEGTDWSLALASVETAGDLSVSINKAGIDGAAKTVTVFKAGQTTDITYTAAADGAAGSVSSTAISLSFSGALGALNAGDISLVGGTGAAVKGALTGEGANWSLAITVITAGDMGLSINRAGIERAVKTVTVHKQAPPPPDISYSVSADGIPNTTTSTALSFTFNSPVSGLTAGDISLVGGTGAAAKGALTGEGTAWSLALTVETEGTLTVSISKAGIEHSAKTLSVFKEGPVLPGIGYKAIANGTAKTLSSTAINFTFNEEVGGLTADDINLVNGMGEVTKGALTGSGKDWTLALDAVETPGYVVVSIEKDGIQAGNKGVIVHRVDRTYTAAADGSAGTVTSTAVNFTFSEALSVLTADDISVSDGTGAVTKGALSGGGTNWSLALAAITRAGDIRVSITKAGIDNSEKTIEVHTVPASIDIDIGFNYGTITITGSDGTNVIYKNSGSPSGITLSADTYSDVKWYVDGADTPEGTGNSITLDASGYSAKKHSVTFTGTKDGKLYSQVIPFTVRN
jgi:hypothetical protein